MVTATTPTGKRGRKALASSDDKEAVTAAVATPGRPKRSGGKAAKVARKPVGKDAALEKGAVAAANGTYDAIKAAALKVTEANLVPDLARSVAKKARKRISRSSASRPKAGSRRAKPGLRPGAGTILGIAAAGIAAGIVANLGRKTVVQAPSIAAGDWLDALKVEHKMALALLDKLAGTTSAQPARRTTLLTQLKHALGKHAFTEENVIYPALREWGDKADADALNHEQGYHKQSLYELDEMDKTAPDFTRKVVDFRADLEAHIREEEDKIFPKLKDGLGVDENKRLTFLANREGFKLA
jgi:hemerythrin superfamily protein